MCLRFPKALVAGYILPRHQTFLAFGLFILLFGIIHQQVAMSRGYVAFIYQRETGRFGYVHPILAQSLVVELCKSECSRDCITSVIVFSDFFSEN